MKIVMFYHSLLSDCNHGNADIERGVVSELTSRGHKVLVYEEKPETLDLDLGLALDGADMVIVHEWNACGLVQRIGKHRQTLGRYMLLFCDTIHRLVIDEVSMSAHDMSNYDRVLVYDEATHHTCRQLVSEIMSTYSDYTMENSRESEAAERPTLRLV